MCKDREFRDEAKGKMYRYRPPMGEDDLLFIAKIFFVSLWMGSMVCDDIILKIKYIDMFCKIFRPQIAEKISHICRITHIR